jgi:DivIVA domain-containing protein
MEPLSAQVASHEFSTIKKGGYDPSEVDAFLTDVSRSIRKLEGEIAVSGTKIAGLEKRVKANKDADKVVQTAFLAAAEAKAKMLEEAERKAAAIVRDAEARATAAGGGAPDAELESVRREAEQILLEAKRRLEQSTEEATARREAAEREAAEIVAEARRRSVTTVGGESTEEQAVAARAELERLVLMLRGLKRAIGEAFDHAAGSSPELEVILGGDDVLAGVLDADPAQRPR